MTSSVIDLKSVALSATEQVVYQVPVDAQSVIVGVSAKYAAVAATSGVTLSFEVSVDGSSYHAAGETSVTVKPAANVLGEVERKIFVQGPEREDNYPVAYIRVTATNLDGTNAVLIAVQAEASDYN